MEIRLYDDEDERFLFESEVIKKRDIPKTVLAVIQTHFPDTVIKSEAYRFILKKGIIQYVLTIVKGKNEQQVIINDATTASLSK